jgi:hypothetical protein
MTIPSDMSDAALKYKACGRQKKPNGTREAGTPLLLLLLLLSLLAEVWLAFVEKSP